MGRTTTALRRALLSAGAGMIAPAQAALSIAALGFAMLASPLYAQNVSTYATGVVGAKGLAWDVSGNLFVSGGTGGAGVIYKVGSGGSPVVTFADGFMDPWGLAFSSSGDLYVVDRAGFVPNAGRIWKVAPDGSKTLFVSGLGDPTSIEFSPSGELFVGEWVLGSLEQVSTAGTVTTYAAGLGGGVGDFVILPTGEIYVGAGQDIKSIGPGGAPVAVFGSVPRGLNPVGTILGLARGSDGVFYASRNVGDVWRVASGGAGLYAGGALGCQDGPLLSSEFNRPYALRIHDGQLYLADAGCGQVRTIDLATPTVHGTWGRVKLLYR